MTTGVYRFVLKPTVPLEEAEMSLQLAIFAAEGLFGSARVRLDAGYHVDEPRCLIIVDGTTEVGAVVTRMFTGLLLRQFGEDGFHVRRVEPGSAGTPDREIDARHTETAAAVA